MEAIYHLLESYRLEKYYKVFLDKGVADERDFIDSVTDEDLQEMGKTRSKLLNTNIHGPDNRQSGLLLFLKEIKSTQKTFSDKHVCKSIKGTFCRQGSLYPNNKKNA